MEVQASQSTNMSSARPGFLLVARELTVMLVVFFGYRQVRYLTRNDTRQALSNATRVLQIQDTLAWVSERSVQRLAMQSHGLIAFLNRYYVVVHFPVTVAFLLWILARHTAWYRTMRNWLIGVTATALIIHVMFPLAPPRMLPGFVDTLRVFGPNIYPTDPTESVANQFAAMPSLHFGWSLIVGIGVPLVVRRRWARLALVHPFLTLTAIVATGNHYFLDAAIAGVLVVLVAVALPRVRGAIRPAAV